MIIRKGAGHLSEGFRPGEPRNQSPTRTAPHGKRPVHHKGRTDHGGSQPESDPVVGPLAIEDLDSATLISARGQLDDDRYFAQAHWAVAEIHVPIVQLILGVAGQLQLTHFFEKREPISRIVERCDVPDALEYPLGLRRPRDPEP